MKLKVSRKAVTRSGRPGGEAEIAAEDDPGMKNEPMSKKQKGLHQADAQNWPGFQTGVSLIQ
jgi:hypothetical protein